MTSPIEFRAWPKIARLKDSNVVITEKIDGTNAAVVINQVPTEEVPFGEAIEDNVLYIEHYGEGLMTPCYYVIGAQSRTRLISPTQDNFGFARWVWDNAEALVATLGPGHHFGEWWGSGIQRGYGLTEGEKRFSLFNSGRWAPEDIAGTVPGLGVVPVLDIVRGSAMVLAVHRLTEDLLANGSRVVEGFMKPEGLVVYHVASKATFKVLFEGDGKPKGLQA